MKPPVQERCRYCARPLNPDDPEHHRHWPFCCERCKMADLGAWFGGRYVISRRVDEVADDAAATDKALPEEEHNSS